MKTNKPTINVLKEFKPLLEFEGGKARCRVMSIERAGGKRKVKFDIRWFKSGEGHGWGPGFSLSLGTVNTLIQILTEAQELIRSEQSDENVTR